jgi:16S rRNA G527 N7-methylase RsmG
MAFWTVIADYRGGTYISQVRAVSALKALVSWAKSFPDIRGSFIGAKTKRNLLAAAGHEQDELIAIKKTRNVWYWNPPGFKPVIVVHLVKTSQS